jgi:hypothetical protein
MISIVARRATGLCCTAAFAALLGFSHSAQAAASPPASTANPAFKEAEWPKDFDEITDPDLLRTLRNQHEYGWNGVVSDELAAGRPLDELIEDTRQAIQSLESESYWAAQDHVREADCLVSFSGNAADPSVAACQERERHNKLRAFRGILKILESRVGTSVDRRSPVITRQLVPSATQERLARVEVHVIPAIEGTDPTHLVLTISPDDDGHSYEVPVGGHVLIKTREGFVLSRFVVDQKSAFLGRESRRKHLPRLGVGIVKALQEGYADITLWGDPTPEKGTQGGNPWVGYEIQAPSVSISIGGKPATVPRAFSNAEAVFVAPSFAPLGDSDRSSFKPASHGSTLVCPGGMTLFAGVCWASCPATFTAAGPLCVKFWAVRIRAFALPTQSCAANENLFGGSCWTKCPGGFQSNLAFQSVFFPWDTPRCYAACPPNTTAAGTRCNAGGKSSAIWVGLDDQGSAASVGFPPGQSCPSGYSSCGPLANNNILQEGIDFASTVILGIGTDVSYAWTENFPDDPQVLWCGLGQCPFKSGDIIFAQSFIGSEPSTTCNIFGCTRGSGVVGHMQVKNRTKQWGRTNDVHNYNSNNVTAEWIIEADGNPDNLPNLGPTTYSGMSVTNVDAPDGSNSNPTVTTSPLTTFAPFKWAQTTTGGPAVAVSPSNAAGSSFTIAVGTSTPPPPPP